MDDLTTVAGRLWGALGGAEDALERLEVVGDRRVLPSIVDVTGFAGACAAAVALAVGEVLAARGAGAPPPVRVDTRRAAATFLSERLFRPEGWSLPDLWDPISGDHAAADGWVRLHANYPWHRGAALSALGLPDDAERDIVARTVGERPAEEIESAVVAAGGCAAALRSSDTWSTHPHGAVAVHEPLLRRDATFEGPGRPFPAPDGRPLAGVRVVDLTRVIAGPVCTRLLAAHGAEVIRVDPPGFAEVGALLPETTIGKRRLALDLTQESDQEHLGRLVAGADVVVHGLRPGALDDLGLGPAWWRERRPGLVVAALDAYGWDGPWADRRGFDSLVQMSVGIAHAGMVATGAEHPVPLPAQALDHGAGHVLAAGILLALADGAAGGPAVDLRTSLVGVANHLRAMPDPDGIGLEPPSWGDDDVERRETGWGPGWGVPAPRDVDGWPGRWDIPAGPLASRR
ncbi:CoA transferase [Actinomarinicola tropica]|uniref:Acyl-CoA transferase n=1 Tax=Actinomarinicola tropica TaxID=2789776 RepID=A0A5Q2RHF6_9ACTN|nr:CoA transferase [Actinomarinicola tropica]QGG95014.1 acyl-CoA transferase [Actinomarinicola tropica]